MDAAGHVDAVAEGGAMEGTAGMGLRKKSRADLKKMTKLWR
jgi:hypothetical protein